MLPVLLMVVVLVLVLFPEQMHMLVHPVSRWRLRLSAAKARRRMARRGWERWSCRLCLTGLGLTLTRSTLDRHWGRLDACGRAVVWRVLGLVWRS